MKLGLVGIGRQGRRYLEPKNAGDSIKFVMKRGDDFTAFLHGLDGVIIATPADTHAELAMRCLHAGKAVLVEKPLATTWRDCAEVIGLAELRGLPLLVGHTHLFSEAWAGRPHAAESFTAAFGGPCKLPAWLDWGPHVVAMALDAMGNPRGGELYRSLNGDHATWCIDFEKPRFAMLTVSGSCSSGAPALGSDIAQLSPSSRAAHVGSWQYNADASCEHTAIWRQVEVFKRMIRGETDRRGTYNFARAVYRTLFGELA